MRQRKANTSFDCACSIQVLLVDDHEFNLEVLVGMLDQLNIKVDTASNGEEAVQMFIDNR